MPHSASSPDPHPATIGQASAPLLSLSEKLKALYRAQDVLPKLIEDEFTPDQKLDDYYVQLQIVMDDKDDKKDKIPIALPQIFSAVADQPAVDKVLVVGVAGVGKSSFLTHIGYEWSKGCIFADQFDYVFKVRMKSLLDSKVPVRLGVNRENALALLLLYSIEQQYESSAQGHSQSALVFTLEEILHADKARTLLLLDGYDEIEYLNKKGSIVSKVISQIFSYQHVVLTSRPNAVSSQLEKKFERKVESIGLGDQGVSQYIDQYFKKQTEKLISAIDETVEVVPELTDKDALFGYYEQHNMDFLIRLSEVDSHTEEVDSIDGFKSKIALYYDRLRQELQEVCEKNTAFRIMLSIPINVAMVTLVSADSHLSQEIYTEKNCFKIGTLYRALILWLGKRYITKFAEIDTEDITDRLILKLIELQVLKQVAHEHFNSNQLFIPGEKIEQTILDMPEPHSYVDIRKVNKFGLMRPEGTREQLELTPIIYKKLDLSELEVGKLYIYLSPNQESLLGCFREWDLFRNFQIDPTQLEGSYVNVKDALRTKKIDFFSKDKQVILYFSQLLQKTHGYSVTYKYVSQGISSQASSELEARNLIAKKHAFVHLSFHEYLTALTFKDILMGVGNSDPSGALRFIALHRNEPRYLTTLKFLAGILSDEASNEKGRPGQDADLAIKRFWTAIVADVDGMIELGMDHRILLWMHLLGQAQQNGVIDPRIPHGAELVRSVDEVVCPDLLSWGDRMVSSGYCSAAMKGKALGAWIINTYTAAILGSETPYLSNEGMVALKRTLGLIRKLAPFLTEQQDLLLKQLHVLLAADQVHWQIKSTALRTLEGLLKVAHDLSSNANMRKIVPKIADWVVQKDKDLNEQALHCLEKMVSRKDLAAFVVQVLIDRLGDEGWPVRYGVVKALGLLEKKVSTDLQEHIVTTLIGRLGDGDKHVRTLAAQGLGLLEKKVSPALQEHIVTTLIGRLGDEDSDVRLTAAEMLGRLGEKVSPALQEQLIPALIATLGDEDSDVRHAAAEMLGRLGEKVSPALQEQIITALIARLGDKDGSMRCRVVYTLGLLGKKVSPALQEQIIPALIDKLEDGRENVRKVAAEVLDQLGPKVELDLQGQIITILIDKLENENSDACQTAMYALSPLIEKVSLDQQEQLITALIATLGDGNENVRYTAVKALGRLGEKVSPALQEQIITALIARLRDKDWEVRYAAEETLDRLGEKVSPALQEQIITALIARLGDKDGSMRYVVVYTLGRLGEKVSPALQEQIIPALIDKLEDGEENVPKMAAEMLYQLGPKVGLDLQRQIITILIDKLENENSDACQTAMYVLSPLIEKFSLDQQEKFSPALQEHIVTVLIATLRDKDWAIREGAAKTLGPMVEKFSPALQEHIVTTLIAMLGDKNKYVCEAAEQALTPIFTFRSFPELVKLKAILSEVSKVGEDLFIQVLTTKLTTQTDAIRPDWICPLLEILGHETNEVDVQKKTLLEAAKKTLYSLLPDVQGVQEAGAEDNKVRVLIGVIQAQDFERLLALSSESRPFIQWIYQAVFQDGHLEPEEAQFVEQCIQQGFPTLWRQDGTVMLEGTTYALDATSQEQVNEMIAGLPAQTISPASLPIQCYGEDLKAPGQSLGLQVSAKTIESVVSRVDGAVLSGQAWHLSVLYLSDDLCSPPGRGLLLLEGRDAFGYYVAHSLSVQSDVFEGKSFVQHPHQLADLPARALLGTISYDQAKPRFYVRTFQHIDRVLGRSLLKKPDTQPDTVSPGAVYVRLNTLLAPFETSLSLSLGEDWSAYVQDSLTHTMTPASLGLGKQDARGRGSIDIQVAQLDTDVQELKTWQAKLEAMDDVLTAVVEDKRADQAQQAILTRIQQHPEALAFYEALRLQLGATYMACSVIQTGMVGNEQQGKAGQIGELLQSASSHIPVIGVGVSVLGTLLTHVDARNQAMAVERYAHWATADEMATFSEALALFLAERLSRAWEPLFPTAQHGKLAKIVRVAGGATEKVTNKVSSLALSALEGIKNKIQSHQYDPAKKEKTAHAIAYAERFLGLEKSTDSSEKAEALAKRVGDAVVDLICSGYFEEVASQQRGSASKAEIREQALSLLKSAYSQGLSVDQVRLQQALLTFSSTDSTSPPTTPSKDAVIYSKAQWQTLYTVCEKIRIYTGEPWPGGGISAFLQDFVLRNVPKSGEDLGGNFVESPAFSSSGSLIPIGFQGTGKASAPTSSGAYMQIGEQHSQADNAVQTLKGDGYRSPIGSSESTLRALSLLVTLLADLGTEEKQNSAVQRFTTQWAEMQKQAEPLEHLVTRLTSGIEGARLPRSGTVREGDVTYIQPRLTPPLRSMNDEVDAAMASVLKAVFTGQEKIHFFCTPVTPPQAQPHPPATLPLTSSPLAATIASKPAPKPASKPASPPRSESRTCMIMSAEIQWEDPTLPQQVLREFWLPQAWALGGETLYQQAADLIDRDPIRVFQAVSQYGSEGALLRLTEQAPEIPGLGPLVSEKKEPVSLFDTASSEEMPTPETAESSSWTIPAWQTVIHTAGLSFKVLDTTVDGLRLIDQPTFIHAKALLFDTTQCYGLYAGVNRYTLAIQGADVMVELYQGDYAAALRQGFSTLTTLAFPLALHYAGMPGMVYGLLVTAYTGYDALSNAYAFYQDYGTPAYQAESLRAYSALNKKLGDFSLQEVDDFSAWVAYNAATLNALDDDKEIVVDQAAWDQETAWNGTWE